jgi:hypothetical protein
MRKRLFTLFLMGLIFYVRFAFLITVMAEERTAGGFYEPLRVVGAKIENNRFLPIIIPSENEIFSEEKRIFGLLFHIRKDIRDPHPFIKLKIVEKEFPFLYLPYTGVLPAIYIPKIYMKIFGTSLYSLRSGILVIFLLFLFVYTGFVQKLDRENYLLISIYLITFPIFGLIFATPFFANAPMIFIALIIILSQIKKVLKNSFIGSREAFLIFLGCGCILHFHLLAGGAIIFSLIFSFFLTERRISLKAKPGSLIAGAFIFILLVFPYIMTSPEEIKRLIFRGKHSVYEILLLPLYSTLYHLIGLFAGPSFTEIFLHDRIDIRYIPFSILSGIIMSFGFVGLFTQEKGKFKNFLLFMCLFYLFITLFGDIRPYHINYVFPFIVPFIQDGLKRIRILSEKSIKYILTIGIFLNIIQIEMLRESIKNSSLSLSLHKEVADYLTKNRIKKIHNIAGMYDYVFISKERIEVIDFIPFIGYNHPRDRIYLSLLLSKGEVILLESYKRAGITTGVSLEEVIDIAKETGLRIRVLKKFPDKGKYELVLARVE